MKPAYAKKIFQGEILDILDKHTMTGKFLVEFRARTEDGKLYLCTIWEKDAERFNSSVKVGDKIHLEGVEKNENELTIKYFKTKEGGSGKKVSGPSPEAVREFRERKRAEGFEFINTPVDDSFVAICKPRKYCIKVNGIWEGKMEYCLKVFGGKFVTDALRDFGDPKHPGSVARNTNPVSFKRILEDLVALAADQSGDTLERADEDVDYLLSSTPIASKPVEMEENTLDNMEIEI